MNSSQNIFVLEKKKFSHSSCCTYILPNISAEEIDKLDYLPQICLPEATFTPQKGLPTIGVILALESGFYSIDEPYVLALLQAGANIKFITYKNVETQLSDIDGVLLIGGFFPTPNNWYVHPSQEAQPPLPPRTLAYLSILDWAYRHKMPIFGVCGGMQMMSGFLGAKLMFLEKDFGYTPFQHKGINANDYAHPIIINSNSLLFDVAKINHITVNSVHSEAVASVPHDKIKISAQTEDGIIEAIEFINYPAFALGVQWHPERMAVQGEIFSKNLYKRFVLEAHKFYQTKVFDNSPF